MVRTMKDSGVDWIDSIPEHWTISRTKNYYTNHKYVVGDKAAEYERLALTLNGVMKRPKDDSTGLQPEEFSGYQILSTDELVFKLIDLQNISTSRVGLQELYHQHISFCIKKKVLTQSMVNISFYQCGKGKYLIKWGMMELEAH